MNVWSIFVGNKFTRASDESNVFPTEEIGN